MPTASNITVTWTAPTSGATPTGYIILYQADGDQGSVMVNSQATMAVVQVAANPTINIEFQRHKKHRISKFVYSITMVTLSTMLPSALSMTVTAQGD